MPPTHDLQVALLDRMYRPVEHAGLTDRRSRLLMGARVVVLEVGAGTGLDLAHYRNVDRVVALEPEPAMVSRLRRAAAEATVPVEIVEAGIEEAELERGSFDTVVCTLVLCTVPDPNRALERIRSLLAPAGRLLFLEHMRVPGLWGDVQRLATPLWKTMVLGCHLDRDPIGAMRETGFVVTDCEHFTMPLVHAKIGRAAQGAAVVSKRDHHEPRPEPEAESEPEGAAGDE